MSAAYTHGHHESVLRSHRWRTAENSAGHLLPHLSGGMRLLDVGAGPGTITADLAGLVREVVATEISEEALALTRAGVAEQGATNVTFAVADVHALPFEDDAFDVAHAHQVLQHVADPVQALRELRRVTKPGGIVAVRDSDYAAFAWYPELPALDDWLRLYREVARANGGEPDAGRRLRAWARAAGFADVTAGSSTWCYTSDDDRAWWGCLWADRITQSAIAHQLRETGLATDPELEAIADGFRAWAADPDGWFSLLHGEILCRA